MSEFISLLDAAWGLV